MKNIKRFDQFINELFVFGDKEDLEGKYVLSIKSKLWVFSDEEFDDHKQDIADELGVVFEDIEQLAIYNSEFAEILANHPSAVIGYINNNRISLLKIDGYRSSRVSPNLNKVVKELGLDGISAEYHDGYGDEEFSHEEEVSPNYNNLKNESFYHGTAISYINKILRFGIAPRNITDNKSNYRVEHLDKVFVSLNKERCYEHGFNTSGKTKSFPIILEITIPDTTKLEVDYDLAADFYRDDERVDKVGYRNIINRQHQMNGKTLDIKNLETRLGVFAYLGRIPASHIQGIWIDKQGYTEYVQAQEFGNEEYQINGNMEDWEFVERSNISSFMDDIYNELLGEYPEESEDDEEFDDEKE